MSSKKHHHSEEAAIRALDAEWDKAARAKQLDRVISFYATDGSVVWPGSPVGKGHAAIRAAWEAAYAAVKPDPPGLWLEFKPSHIEIASGGDMASDFGAVHFAPNAKPDDIVNVGKYLVIWKREHGTWKVLYDCWNMNGSDDPLKKS